MPEGTAFGLDTMTYLVGSKFRGVKMIPPGPHFISTSAAFKNVQFAPVVGAFIYIESRQVPAMPPSVLEPPLDHHARLTNRPSPPPPAPAPLHPPPLRRTDPPTPRPAPVTPDFPSPFSHLPGGSAPLGREHGGPGAAF